MFDQLDRALGALLDDTALRGALPQLFDADVSFVTPEQGYKPPTNTVNLFLYETKEDRELRQAAPAGQAAGGLGLRSRATLRVDCSYMVTAWSTRNNHDKVAAEHQLLGQAFNWLSRFPRVPLRYFDAAARPGQVFEPPTLVAQMDGAKSAGEFWHALGIPPRPYFNLMVTIAMDLDQSVEDALVTTLTTEHHAGDPTAGEERVLVGGTVRGGPSRTPVANAWVRLEPRGEVAITNAAGRFVFEQARRGQRIGLRARAPGYGEAVRLNLEVPSPTGEYDLSFP